MDPANDRCSLGRAPSGYQTLLINDTVVDLFTSLEAAVKGYSLVRQAGVCSDEKQVCLIGRAPSGYQTVSIDGTVVDNYASLEGAVAAIKTLKHNGICKL